MNPIRPEEKDRYPDDWKEISDRIRFERAESRCECRGECGRDHKAQDTTWTMRCSNRHGDPSIETGKQVTLTVAHLDHTPENCDDDNLKAMCNGCHLRYDRDHHAATRRETQRRQRADAGQMELAR